jgi:VanZ family protein
MKSAIIPAAAYACVILGLSSIPGKSFPDLNWLSYDKLIHIGEYMIFGFLVSHMLRKPIHKRYYLLLVTLLLAGTFGGLDELYQYLIPGRLPSYGDWVADVIGVLTGSLIYISVKFNRAQASTR